MPRFDLAVITRDGTADIVNVGRPDTLIAFADAHAGKIAPETPAEYAWCAHYTVGASEPLEKWIRTIETCSQWPDDLALARAIIAGGEAGEHAKRVALGLEPPDEDLFGDALRRQLDAGMAVANGNPPTVAPAAAPAPETRGASRSRR